MDGEISEPTFDGSSTNCDCCENVNRELAVSARMRNSYYEDLSSNCEFYPGKDDDNNLYEVVSRHTNTMRRTNISPIVATNPYPFWSCLPVPAMTSDDWSMSATQNRRKSMKNLITSLEGAALAIGIIGLAFGLAGLTAYLIVQTPQLRKDLGPTYAIRDGSLILAPTDDVFYGLELAGVVTVTILAILVNFFLIYGILSESSAFLLPWLCFHVGLIIALICATIVIVVFVFPFINRAYAAIPLTFAIAFIFFWTTIFKMFRRLRADHHRLQASASAILHSLPPVSRRTESEMYRPSVDWHPKHFPPEEMPNFN